MNNQNRPFNACIMFVVLVISFMLSGCFEDTTPTKPLPQQPPPQVTKPVNPPLQPPTAQENPVTQHWAEIGQQALDGKRCSTWWMISRVTPEAFWSAVSSHVSSKWPDKHLQTRGTDSATYQIPVGKTLFDEDRIAQVQVVISAAGSGAYRVDWRADVQIADKSDVVAILQSEAGQLCDITSGFGDAAQPAANLQLHKLTATEKAHLASIKDISGAIVTKWSPFLNKANKWNKTYDAADAILKTSPSTEPGSPLVKVAALMDLVLIWRPGSALDSFNVANENQYSSLLKSVASSLNDISSNIEKRDIRGGWMLHYRGTLMIFMATLMDAKAVDASFVPDSLVTQEVVNWYVENSELLASLIGEGPKVQKKSLLGRDDWREDFVDRGALKVWCYDNRKAVKYYLYENAIVPENLSYLSGK